MLINKMDAKVGSSDSGKHCGELEIVSWNFMFGEEGKTGRVEKKQEQSSQKQWLPTVQYI